MLTFTSNDPRSCGIVEIDNKGIVINFHEKLENPLKLLMELYTYLIMILDWLMENHPKARFQYRGITFLSGKYMYHTKMPYVDIGTPNKLKARSLKK